MRAVAAVPVEAHGHEPSWGPLAFEASGNYDWMWYADIALCLFAAAVHLPIKEARPKLAAAAA